MREKSSISQKLYKIRNRVLSKTLNINVVRSTPKICLDGYDEFRKNESPRYVNIGSGKWRHPYWHTLDYPFEGYEKSQGGCDIVFDLMSMSPLPIKEDSLDAVYTSHTIEHLNNQAVMHLFSEVLRCMKRGAIFRITCPDASLAYSAYLREDYHFWRPHHHWHTKEQLLLSTINTSASTMIDSDLVAKTSDTMVCQTLTENGIEEAFDKLSPEKSKEIINAHPQSHDAWFTEKKLVNMLLNSGFTNVWTSRFGQSRSVIMRDTGYFDKTRPDISLYVEASR